jgi:hypothetical protein
MAEKLSAEEEWLYAAIGRLTISWAHVEAGLDYIVGTIHDIGGKNIEPEMPWALVRKIKYIRKCFQRIDALAEFQALGLPLLNRITDASDARHDIIHGSITEHIEGTDTAKMMRFLRLKTGREMKFFTVRSLDVMREATNAAKLGNESLNLARALRLKFFPQTAD